MSERVLDPCCGSRKALMHHPNDATRCLGQLPGPDETTHRCTKRESCQRYLQRHEGGERRSFAMWLCPGRDDYWQFFVESEPHASAVKT